MGSLCSQNGHGVIEEKEEIESGNILSLFDREYDECLQEELIKISKIACKTLNWDKLDNNCFNVEVLTGGLSNKLYTISIICNKDNIVSSDKLIGVIRIFNDRTQLTFDEIYNIYSAFHASGIGTNVYGRFENGQIEAFIHGESIKDIELRRNSTLYLNTAQILSIIHSIDGTKYCPTFDARKPKINSTLNKYLLFISSIFEKQVNQQSNIEKWEFIDPNNNKKNKKISNNILVNIIENEIKWLNAEIINYKYGYIQDVVFSHNDLHGGNIMNNNGILKVIDYEFAGYNYRCFDFGNYYNELHINNDSGSSPGFEIVADNFPNKQYQNKFVKTYFENFLTEEEYKRENIDDKLENICNGMKLGCLLSHIRWGLWGISESVRNDPDWDYLEYGRQRLLRYYQVKKQYLSDKQ